METVELIMISYSALQTPSLKLASAKCPEICSQVVVATLATSEDNANLVQSDKDKKDQIFRGLMPLPYRRSAKMRN